MRILILLFMHTFCCHIVWEHNMRLNKDKDFMGSGQGGFSMVDFLYGTLLDNLIWQIHMISVKLNKAKSLMYVHEMT